MTRTALITGSSGFIGFHLAQRLLAEGIRVVGVDNLSDYYDVALKQRRQAILLENPLFTTETQAVETPGLLEALFATHRPQIVVHLAAQAGVRWSIDNPRAYLDANLRGSFELMEAARLYPPEHVLLASTSSVYGSNTDMPYTEVQRADHQMSFYAATKKAVEAMTHSYAHIYDLPVTMFRFFTVYGPWGRPDMALFKFTRAVLEGRPIDVYNHGDLSRDFTYIDDLIDAVRAVIDLAPQRPAPGVTEADLVAVGDSLSPVAPWRVLNVGHGAPVQLVDFIAAIEAATGREAIRNLLPMQPGDVPATWADTGLLRRLTGHSPQTDVFTGVGKFVDWYRDYYQI